MSIGSHVYMRFIDILLCYVALHLFAILLVVITANSNYG